MNVVLVRQELLRLTGKEKKKKEWVCLIFIIVKEILKKKF